MLHSKQQKCEVNLNFEQKGHDETGDCEKHDVLNPPGEPM